MTRKAARLLAAIAVAAAGCGARAPGAVDGHGASAATPAWLLTYRLTGGLAGFDVSFTVASDGSARYQRSRPRAASIAGRLEPAEVAALARLVRDQGLTQLAASYPSRLPVRDGYRYSLRWEEAGRSHETVADDGAEMPPAFVSVREAVAALERKVIASGEGKGRGEGS